MSWQPRCDKRGLRLVENLFRPVSIPVRVWHLALMLIPHKTLFPFVQLEVLLLL